MSKSYKTKSKFLSLVLRHQPELAGIELDDAGWTTIDKLLAGCALAGTVISREDLAEIVRTSDKQRFALSEDGQRIRANQGHSVPVELGYAPMSPPDVLYHGSASQYIDSIRSSGLSKQLRHDVHLSESIESTMKVGQRKGVAVLVTIDARAMAADGHEFYKTPNGVWLTDHVPPKYLTINENGTT